jgi:hypothetical protein
MFDKDGLDGGSDGQHLFFFCVYVCVARMIVCVCMYVWQGYLCVCMYVWQRLFGDTHACMYMNVTSHTCAYMHTCIHAFVTSVL